MHELMWSGADMVRISREDIHEYGTALHIHATMKLRAAIAQAPDTYAELNKCSTGEMLLAAVEQYLERVPGQQAVASKRPNTSSAYEDFARDKLQHLARRVISLQKTHPQEMASLSLITYALLGFADDRESNDYDVQCQHCYRTAVWPSKYCAQDYASDENRLRRTKKRGAQENLEVSRRRGRRIQQIAAMLRRNQQSLCCRLFRQLFGMTGGLNPLPPPLESLQDDEFATGARIGPNGGRWFIYLWESLPRVREMLGLDWVDLVLTAMNDEEWSFVIRRLKEIDPNKESTDARDWVMTLIEAEEWLEAAEIERQQRRRPGRPPRDPSNPKIQEAMAQLNDGKSPEKVAASAGVSVSTIYRWKTTIKSLPADNRSGETVASQLFEN